MDFTTGSWFTFSNRVKHKQLHFLLFFPGLTVTVSGISDTWYLKAKYLQRLKFFFMPALFLIESIGECNIYWLCVKSNTLAAIPCW